jgi:hypothetical protein
MKDQSYIVIDEHEKFQSIEWALERLNQIREKNFIIQNVYKNDLKCKYQFHN